MDLIASFRHREAALIAELDGMRALVDDRTGKGTNTEVAIEKALLRGFMPPGFALGKGTVVCGPPECQQSAAIDRVVYCTRDCSPLLISEDGGHSIFPLESVAAVVEITLHLDARKLREDVEKIRSAREIKRRHYLKSLDGSKTLAVPITTDQGVGPRAYIVGLPSSMNWSPDTIARTLAELQTEVGTLVHGLYVLGIGYFATRTSDQPQEKVECIPMTSDARMFRFVTAFRSALDRWVPLPAGTSAHLDAYLPHH